MGLTVITLVGHFPPCRMLCTSRVSRLDLAEAEISASCYAEAFGSGSMRAERGEFPLCALRNSCLQHAGQLSEL